MLTERLGGDEVDWPLDIDKKRTFAIIKGTYIGIHKQTIQFYIYMLGLIIPLNTEEKLLSTKLHEHSVVSLNVKSKTLFFSRYKLLRSICRISQKMSHYEEKNNNKSHLCVSQIFGDP